MAFRGNGPLFRTELLVRIVVRYTSGRSSLTPAPFRFSSAPRITRTIGARTLLHPKGMKGCNWLGGITVSNRHSDFPNRFRALGRAVPRPRCDSSLVRRPGVQWPRWGRKYYFYVHITCFKLTSEFAGVYLMFRVGNLSPCSQRTEPDSYHQDRSDIILKGFARP